MNNWFICFFTVILVPFVLIGFLNFPGSSSQSSSRIIGSWLHWHVFSRLMCSDLCFSDGEHDVEVSGNISHLLAVEYSILIPSQVELNPSLQCFLLRQVLHMCGERDEFNVFQTKCRFCAVVLSNFVLSCSLSFIFYRVIVITH